ncbi:hypothetical protein VMCG_04636 [Cytospora schulzeri]|uniref:Uncharacterized protein n=1 Tax=Cytospora schulzeri TaxID=448051 RepID=A0A423WRG8_9PEZI|nr:hypothetical protein VMCG_04636 [Valsa malicola]
MAIPHIRRLTIVVQYDPRASWYMDNDFHQLLQWMCRRCKPGSKARYYWALEDLTLTDGPRHPLPKHALWCHVGRRWTCGDLFGYSRCGCGIHKRWTLSEYEKALIEKLRGCGVKVELKTGSLREW